MSGLLTGKTALILGIANKWSLAYAIAQAFRREGAKLLLTYQGERVKQTVEELGAAVGAAHVFDCDVTKDEDLSRLTGMLEAEGRARHGGAQHRVCQSRGLGAAPDRDIAGGIPDREVSAYSMIAVARATRL